MTVRNLPDDWHCCSLTSCNNRSISYFMHSIFHSLLCASSVLLLIHAKIYKKVGKQKTVNFFFFFFFTLVIWMIMIRLSLLSLGFDNNIIFTFFILHLLLSEHSKCGSIISHSWYFIMISWMWEYYLRIFC